MNDTTTAAMAVNAVNEVANGNVVVASQLNNALIDVNAINAIDNNATTNATPTAAVKKVKLENNNNVNHNNNNNVSVNVIKSSTLNNNNSQSRVVHIRNIPSDTVESDLIALSMSFGRITNCLVLRGKSQAFVEFESFASAQQMVQFWAQTTISGIATTLQPTIRGRNVFCQLSNHKELKTNQNLSLNINNESHNNGAVLLDAMDGNCSGGRRGSGSVGGDSCSSSQSSSCVLRVVVDNLLYPVSLDVLHAVFSRVGKVAKIVTFTKGGAFQALIQYGDAHSAQTAKHVLDGQNLFHSANTLRIEFSKLQQLNIKYNNEKSRDYTNPALPATGHAQPSSVAAQSHSHSAHSHSHAQSAELSLAEQQLMASLVAQSSLAPQMTSIFANPFATVAPQVSTLRAIAANHGFASANHHHASALNALNAHHLANMSSAVLLVSNLNEKQTTCDELFTLFGVYGDVIRVKILFNKKDNALIQMSEPSQSHLALTYLDKVKLFGNVIRVTQSKHQLVQMPKEGQHDAGLTKDYSQSPLHRFKKPGSKNYGNIYPPSATLHLSNIPSTVSEDDIRNAFAARCADVSVVAFKFFPKDRKMALIQLSSVDEAIVALIAMHNCQLSESSHLRVSFSKSSI